MLFDYYLYRSFSYKIFPFPGFAAILENKDHKLECQYQIYNILTNCIKLACFLTLSFVFWLANCRSLKTLAIYSLSESSVGIVVKKHVEIKLFHHSLRFLTTHFCVFAVPVQEIGVKSILYICQIIDCESF